MRNLNEYPITYEEAHEILRRIYGETVGDYKEKDSLDELKGSAIAWIDFKLHKLSVLEKELKK